MANGITVMNPVQARDKAIEMKKLAGEIRTLLDNVSLKINEINDKEKGTYAGNKNPAEIREQLNQFRTMFNRVYEQIEKSAKNIETIANVKENE